MTSSLTLTSDVAFEGLISSSIGSAIDERLVFLSGYQLAVGASMLSRAATTKGVVAIINAASKTIDASTTWTAGSIQEVRSVGSIDGTNLYVTTSDSTLYMTKGQTTAPTVLTGRGTQVFVTKSRVYVSRVDSYVGNINTFGAVAFPTTSGQVFSAAVNGTGQFPNVRGFAILDKDGDGLDDLAYLCSPAAGYGLIRFDLVNGVWQKAWNLELGNNPCGVVAAYRQTASTYTIFMTGSYNVAAKTVPLWRTVDTVVPGSVPTSTVQVSTTTQDSDFRGMAIVMM